MKEAINRSKTPWSLDDDDAHWVVSLYKSGEILNSLDEIINAVDYDFEFSLEDKFFCVQENQDSEQIRVKNERRRQMIRYKLIRQNFRF